jgi:hypothetical protein
MLRAVWDASRRRYQVRVPSDMVVTTFATASKSSLRVSPLSRSYDSPYLSYAGCVLLALGYYLIFFNYGIDLDDEGFVVGGASAIRTGQFPIADFLSYQPWIYFSLAGFFHVFGETLRVERACLIVYLLVDIVCLLWLSRKVLPPLPALIPVIFYALAPGPWYRVFFVFCILIVLVALFFFNDRPSPWRALLVGLATGFAAITRVEAASVSVIVFVGALGLVAFCDLRSRQKLGSVALRLTASAVAFIVGIVVPVVCMAIPYAATGKLDALIAKVARYVDPAVYNFSVGLRGTADMLHLRALFSQPSLDQGVYAVAMMACLALTFSNAALLLLVNPEHFVGLRQKIVLGALAIGSMGETFFFIWNSRMLSTFAIVILAIVTLLYDVTMPRPSRWRIAAFAGGCAVIAVVIVLFARAVDYYSGSITVRFFARYVPEYREPRPPFLKGAMIWTAQADSIDLLYEIAQKDPNATLIPMSYATTMGYLSGLPNPTYYRLFTAEMAGDAAQTQAIGTFEQFQIKYFVARRGEFFSPDGTDPAALALAGMPLIKDYLLTHYDIRPLGELYLILVRRGDVATGAVATEPQARD